VPGLWVRIRHVNNLGDVGHGRVQLFSLIDPQGCRTAPAPLNVTKNAMLFSARNCRFMATSGRHATRPPYNSILHATFQLKEMTENVVGWGATR